ncbi:1-phosphofructokinase family hexose kinase [Chitinophaga tropicalis]|uniref:Hexose kinase n=1 Tax=Chitinophaga tropicalis TaxID=2683588 RepID=A0A7K1U2X8_9BACT|nr:1-phosphofructokinase family hexose kinase [Chitinophaga tropicalis]MVT08722.1 hexose kinase [Chitinophaga tropicalis]
MILTITMNPAIDKSSVLDKMIPEKKLRCGQAFVEAGGGGINVSKAIKELGGESCALFPAGGLNGKLLQQLLCHAGIPSSVIGIGGETRENFTITEQSSGLQYRFVLPGPVLQGEETARCLQTITSMAPVPDIIVASGSLPPGVPDDFLAKLARYCKTEGLRLIVDTSGHPLQLAVRESIYLLKPNLTELCSLSGRSYLELDEVANVARGIIKQGYCEVMIVSMGPAGAMLVTADASEIITAPIVKRQSTVGAGDSMVAGITWMLDNGHSLYEAARFGVACGTAATMNPGTQLFKREDVYRLYQWINQQHEKSSR